jgi:predicted Zn-dependent protease
MSLTQNLEKLLAAGRDDALLRFGLGNACLREGRAEDAALHLQAAVTHDPGYSAAWKLLGKALTGCGRAAEAVDAYERGVRAAEAKGDAQAAREMRVFLRRLQKPPAGPGG